MPRISYRERHRRIRKNLEEAWAAAQMPADDPGLRDVYERLPRARIRLICCRLVMDPNQGGLLRLAEAFRLERVELTPEEDGARDFSGAMGARQKQPFRWILAEEAIAEARADGYRIYGLTVSKQAAGLRNVDWQFPAAIVLGEEKRGLLPEIAELCDEHVAIPMYGVMASLNVGMAAAIAVEEAVNAYAKANPEFQPARNVSRRLLGLQEVDYLSEEWG